MDVDINDFLVDLRSVHPMDKRYSIMHFAANVIEELTAERDALQANREPLSDLHILNIAEVVDGKTRTREDLFVDFARAIEAAHGIGGE